MKSPRSPHQLEADEHSCIRSHVSKMAKPQVEGFSCIRVYVHSILLSHRFGSYPNEYSPSLLSQVQLSIT